MERHLWAIRGVSRTAHPVIGGICSGRKAWDNWNKFDMVLKLVASALRKLRGACRRSLLLTYSSGGARPHNITHIGTILSQASADNTWDTYINKSRSVSPHTWKANFEALGGWPVATNRHLIDFNFSWFILKCLESSRQILVLLNIYRFCLICLDLAFWHKN